MELCHLSITNVSHLLCVNSAHAQTRNLFLNILKLATADKWLNTTRKTIKWALSIKTDPGSWFSLNPFYKMQNSSLISFFTNFISCFITHSRLHPKLAPKRRRPVFQRDIFLSIMYRPSSHAELYTLCGTHSQFHPDLALFRRLSQSSKCTLAQIRSVYTPNLAYHYSLKNMWTAADQ